jgi:hypothetical protein
MDEGEGFRTVHGGKYLQSGFTAETRRALS